MMGIHYYVLHYSEIVSNNATSITRFYAIVIVAIHCGF